MSDFGWGDYVSVAAKRRQAEKEDRQAQEAGAVRLPR